MEAPSEQLDRRARAAAQLRVIQESVDNLVEERVEAQDEDAQCKVGCASCCYHLVPATLPEVVVALLEALKNGHRKLVERGLRQMRKDYNTLVRIGWDEQRWFKLRRPCIFLAGGNRCAVYNARPLACRAYVAFSDPDECRRGGQVRISDAMAKYPELVAGDLAEVAAAFDTTDKRAPMQALLPYAAKLLAAEVQTSAVPEG